MQESKDIFPPDSPDAFLRLLTRHERSLALYVHAMVPQLADAQDILQETKIALWNNFTKFETGTDFRAWARKIAFHQVLNYRRGEKRRHRFSDAFLESIAAELEKNPDTTDPRSEVLSECLGRLAEGHRRLVQLRYFEELTVEEIGARIGKSPGAVYRALSRIRLALHDCLSAKLNHLTGTA